MDDQDLENLSIHEWFCWARFGAYIKKHGKDGKIRLRAPATAIINLFRLGSFDEVLSMLKRFPNYVVEEGHSETTNVTNAIVSFNIRCLNWSRYQGDLSSERTRKWRMMRTSNVTIQEERRRDVEEKRRDVPFPNVTLPLATSTSTAEELPLTPREKGTNPRAAGTNPRATGTNPRALGTNPKAIPSKPCKSQPEIPDQERMSPEEMEAIRKANMGQKTQEETAAIGTPEDVF